MEKVSRGIGWGYTSAMLLGILAGAGLLALLDAALQISVPAGGLGREYLLLVVAGNLGAATAIWMGMQLAARLPRFGGFFQRRLSFGAGFWLGVFIGLTPFLTLWVPVNATLNPTVKTLVKILWLIPSAVGVCLAPRLATLASPSFKFLKWVAIPAPLAWLIALAMPGVDWAQPVKRPTLSSAQPTQVPPGKPDLILVSVDTLRADLYRDGKPLLPILEKLARQGLHAEFGLANSNQTVPSHVTMLTGLGPMQHGLQSNLEQPSPTMPFMAKSLQAAGWRTAAVVSNALLASSFGFGAGFEAFDDSVIGRLGPPDRFVVQTVPHTWAFILLRPRPAKDFVTRWFGLDRKEGRLPPGMGATTLQSALDYLQVIYQGTAPGFLFVHFMDPHDPYTPSAETAGTWSNDFSLPDVYANQAMGSHEQLRSIAKDLNSDQKARGRQALQKMRALYDEEVVFLDRQIERLVEAIEASGRPTLLLITGDHGEHFGEWNKMLHSNSMHEALLRVPFVMAGFHGVDVPARKVSFPLHLKDVAPTFLSAAGLPFQSLPGRDLLLQTIEAAPHLSRWMHHLAVRIGDWKLLADMESGGKVKPLALYNLADDPSEGTNRLADAPAAAGLEKLQQMAELASQKEAEFNRSALAGSSAARLALLKEMGYVDS